MRIKTTAVCFVAIGILFYCCTPKLIPPSLADADRGKVLWNDYSLETLNQAHTLYINKCGTCHSLKMPSSESAESWKKIVPPMARKAKLSAEEENTILRYVLTMREAKK
jgi:hypothetical protein